MMSWESCFALLYFRENRFELSFLVIGRCRFWISLKGQGVPHFLAGNFATDNENMVLCLSLSLCNISFCVQIPKNAKSSWAKMSWAELSQTKSSWVKLCRVKPSRAELSPNNVEYEHLDQTKFHILPQRVRYVIYVYVYTYINNKILQEVHHPTFPLLVGSRTQFGTKL